MTKDELITSIEESRIQFLALIDSFEEEQILSKRLPGDRSIKDILMHLIMWEGQLITLLWQASMGKRPTTAHFDRIGVDAINQQWLELMQDRPLEAILEDFHDIREQTIRRIETFSTEDLNNPKKYPWLKSSPLLEWIKNDTSEHEKEHATEIRKLLDA